MNSLLTQFTRPALDCRFVQRNRNWLAGTRRCLEQDLNVHWQQFADLQQLPVSRLTGSLVVCEYAGGPWKPFLKSVHEIYSRGNRIIAVADRKPGFNRTSLTMAGACCVVTSYRNCDQVARIIARCCQLLECRVVDRRDAIRQRFPWRHQTSLSQGPP